jgi:hypothetical protein
MDERTRAGFREFHWPRAMVEGLLPWEATQLGLAALRDYLRVTTRPGEPGLRPPIRWVRWAWRMQFAMPGATYEELRPWVQGAVIMETIGRLPANYDLRIAFSIDELHELFPGGLPEGEAVAASFGGRREYVSDGLPSERDE